MSWDAFSPTTLPINHPLQNPCKAHNPPTGHNPSQGSETCSVPRQVRIIERQESGQSAQQSMGCPSPRWP